MTQAQHSPAITQEVVQLNPGCVQSLIDLAQAGNAIREHEGTTHLVIPDAYRHIELTEAIERVSVTPRRKSGTVVLHDLDSFLVYAQEQGAPDRTYIYADVDSRTLTAVFNDHRSIEHKDLPGWRDHRAQYQAALSPEYATWKENSHKQMDQETFAVFLEDNIADITEPAGDKLLAVALSLQAKTEVNFSSARRLDNGQVQLVYEENTTASAAAGALEIPREFGLGMRLFKGGEGYRLRARLKYRLAGGKLKFWYELDRPHRALEDAFTGYLARVREGAFTVLVGKA